MQFHGLFDHFRGIGGAYFCDEALAVPLYGVRAKGYGIRYLAGCESGGDESQNLLFPLVKNGTFHLFR